MKVEFLYSPFPVAYSQLRNILKPKSIAPRLAISKVINISLLGEPSFIIIFAPNYSKQQSYQQINKIALNNIFSNIPIGYNSFIIQQPHHSSGVTDKKSLLTCYLSQF